MSQIKKLLVALLVVLLLPMLTSMGCIAPATPVTVTVTTPVTVTAPPSTVTASPTTVVVTQTVTVSPKKELPIPLDIYKKAKINWRQCEGERLYVALYRHPYTESLVPLIPVFENLTGIKVTYDIYGGEYNQKLLADLSSGAGIFDVILIGPVWPFAKPGWIEPLDKYLADPTLCDLEWYNLTDFPDFVWTCCKWDLKSGPAELHAGKGTLWAIPVMYETYIIHYRKDLFDKYGVKAVSYTHLTLPTN